MSPQSGHPWMLQCVLRAEDGSETSLSIPSLGRTPPSRIRVPSHLGGAAVLDVYELSHPVGGPSAAIYTFLATVPRTIGELAEPVTRESGPDPIA